MNQALDDALDTVIQLMEAEDREDHENDEEREDDEDATSYESDVTRVGTSVSIEEIPRPSDAPPPGHHHAPRPRLPVWAPPGTSLPTDAASATYIFGLYETRIRLIMETRAVVPSWDLVDFEQRAVVEADQMRASLYDAENYGVQPGPLLEEFVSNSRTPFSARWPVGTDFRHIARPYPGPSDFGGSAWWERYPTMAPPTARIDPPSMSSNGNHPIHRARTRGQTSASSSTTGQPRRRRGPRLSCTGSGGPVTHDTITLRDVNFSDSEESVTSEFARDLGLGPQDTLPFRPAGDPADPAGRQLRVEHKQPCRSCARKPTRCVGVPGESCTICKDVSKKGCEYAGGGSMGDDQWCDVTPAEYFRITHKMSALKRKWKGKGRADGQESPNKRRRMKVQERAADVVATVEDLVGSIAHVNAQLEQLRASLDQGTQVDDLRLLAKTARVHWDIVAAAGPSDISLAGPSGTQQTEDEDMEEEEGADQQNASDE
ncbi:hypothetical protein CONPUDRAFT_160699 [Coniophora puteana RWD-64-598 SS2]|uniref:Uncharacterized protein n=1 Tax=Coniophora puteana (strain RWD-64-598) TaxID=741705 RepID=R7SDG9_CONPW|nr:uncharacterized protein CONPUDRAFT_160699 [Coniophora puteana RWD-64-598 SS2]EIW73802.1 hypothetical protein CONPUDRAFT_160699 [Coniophora puteana RWD-64-598 SS2]